MSLFHVRYYRKIGNHVGGLENGSWARKTDKERKPICVSHLRYSQILWYKFGIGKLENDLSVFLYLGRVWAAGRWAFEAQHLTVFLKSNGKRIFGPHRSFFTLTFIKWNVNMGPLCVKNCYQILLKEDTHLGLGIFLLSHTGSRGFFLKEVAATEVNCLRKEGWKYLLYQSKNPQQPWKRVIWRPERNFWNEMYNIISVIPRKDNMK